MKTKPGTMVEVRETGFFTNQKDYAAMVLLWGLNPNNMKREQKEFYHYWRTGFFEDDHRTWTFLRKPRKLLVLGEPVDVQTIIEKLLGKEPGQEFLEKYVDLFPEMKLGPDDACTYVLVTGPFENEWNDSAKFGWIDSFSVADKGKKITRT